MTDASPPNDISASTAPRPSRWRSGITPEQLAILVDLFGGRLLAFETEQATRFPLRDCRARVQPADVPRAESLECAVLDVSLRELGVDGACLGLPEGTAVKVQILHPALHPRRWNARVTAASSSVTGRRRVGLRFEPPPALPS